MMATPGNPRPGPALRAKEQGMKCISGLVATNRFASGPSGYKATRLITDTARPDRGTCHEKGLKK